MDEKSVSLSERELRYLEDSVLTAMDEGGPFRFFNFETDEDYPLSKNEIRTLLVKLGASANSVDHLDSFSDAPQK